MKREEDFEANLSGEEGTSEESKTTWFKRIKKGILTSTAEKKETPEGLWTKCPNCNYICTMTELRENLFVCPNAIIITASAVPNILKSCSTIISTK